MVDTGRAAAFFMDDILLYSLVASARNPGDWVIGSEAYTVEPYGIMMRRDDPAFKKVVDDAVTQLYKSGQIDRDLRQVVPEADPAQGRQPQRADEPAVQEGGGEPDRLGGSGRLQLVIAASQTPQ